MKTPSSISQFRENSGFSLIEAMVSILILGICLVALVGLQTLAYKMINTNLINQNARDLIVGVIEDTKTLNSDKLKQADMGDVLPGGVDDYTNLEDKYELAGIDTSLPTDFDYVRWKGETRYKDPATNNGPMIYTIKLAIQEKFLPQDILARGRATVYWKAPGNLSGRAVDFISIDFFAYKH